MCLNILWYFIGEEDRTHMVLSNKQIKNRKK
jgi:hypothetical protein